MKIKTIPHPKGLSLIELLVVVAIIGILASIAVPMASSIRNKGKSSQTELLMVAFKKAVDDYYSDNGHLPQTGANPTTDTIIAGNEIGELIDVLTNPSNANNVGGKKYLDTEGSKRNVNGIIYNAANSPTGLRDGWGNDFYIQMDYDMDGSINQNISPSLNSPGLTSPVIGERVILVSPGSNRSFETANSDDIPSWK